MDDPKNDTPANVPKSLPVLGAMFGALTLVFFMGLVIAAMFDKAVPQSAKFIVIVVLAIGTALATTFLGGTAAVNGTIPLPFLKGSPMTFAAGGGLAALIIVLIFGWYFYAASNPIPVDPFKCKPPCDVEVVYGGTDGLNLRSYPSKTNPNNIIAPLLKGSRLTAKAGPKEADDNLWWQAEVDPGWIAERCTSNGIPCIRSVEGNNPIAIDHEIIVFNTESNTGVPLRRDPNSSSEVIATLLNSSRLKVIEGPANVGGTNWWKVRMAPGWIAEGSLDPSVPRLLRVIPH